MKPTKLDVLLSEGKIERYKKGDAFYSLDFKDKLHLIKSGYVKRYYVNEEKVKIIEAIYGPGYYFPLTPVFNKVFSFKLSQDSSTYVYQAITNVQVQSISLGKLKSALSKDDGLYSDLFFEAGRRLRSNIYRLASNSLTDNYKKVAHLLVFIAGEFGDVKRKGVKKGLHLLIPVTPKDIAEQLNLSVNEVEGILGQLQKQRLIKLTKDSLTIPDIDILKDVYL